MPHADEFDRWDARVQAAFPDVLPHHRRALAEYSFGMALSGRCGLTTVVGYLAALFTAGAYALEQRLRELFRPANAQKGSARTESDYRPCFGPLARRAAGDNPDKRLVPALDPTCLTDRFRVLCVAVLHRGYGLPVAWAVQRAEDTGSWNGIWADLLGRLREALGEGWTVLVLTDRGLESQALFRALVGLGWHPLMRVKAGGKFRPTGWNKGHGMARFAPSVGRRFAAQGVAYPTGERLECTLLAAWEAGHEEPWAVLTDLPPAGADVAWYGWRMWIEQGFRAVKRGQWQWHQTQMDDPERAARLWAAVALATVWMMEVGGAGEPAEMPRVPRRTSTLRAGLLRLFVTLVCGVPLPAASLKHHDWPRRLWASDPLTEDRILNPC